MDTIFITGATGFVGVNLRAYLKNEGLKNVGVSRVLDIDNATIDYPLFYNELVIGKNTIIHLAGKAHDLKKTADTKAYFEVNYGLTKKIYDSFLKSESDTFIYISSVKAVRDSCNEIVTETEKPIPITAYGKSKLKAEQYILANLNPSKRVYILRPCMIHGPGNKGNLNLLYKLVVKGFPWPLGAFTNQRSFLSIENFCFVIKELILQKEVSSGIYNVADDVPLSTNELIVLMGDTLGKKGKIWTFPSKWVKLIAYIGDFLRLPLNSDRLQKLTENYVVSNQKIVTNIQKPLPVSSRKGLVLTFKSFIKKM